ncbi:hypothetical protein AB1484_35920 [Parafrankia sp. FMc6]|uniref:hypothetical protein n=1 Tax=Parafrankia soli TaxID=2599596 RepID=UPI0034D528A4
MQQEAEIAYAKLLATADAPRVENPLEELAKVAGEIVAVKDLFRERLANLGENAWRYQGQGAEQLRSEVALFERALDRTVTVLGVFARLNIDERLARIAEEQGQAISTVMIRMAARLGLDLDDPTIRDMVLEEIDRAQRESGHDR